MEPLEERLVVVLSTTKPCICNTKYRRVKKRRRLGKEARLMYTKHNEFRNWLRFPLALTGKSQRKLAGC